MGNTRRAFSLIEVIAAVAIFVIGIVGVMSLFAPVAQSVVGVADSEAAAAVADAVRARIQALDFATAATFLEDSALVQKEDASTSYNPNSGTNPHVIFGKLNGEVGFYNATRSPKGWYDSGTISSSSNAGNLVADADKFFEIELIRNDTISPAVNVATSATLAYTMRVRWPAFISGPNGAAIQVGANTGNGVAFDQSKKQVLYFTGFVTR